MRASVPALIVLLAALPSLSAAPGRAPAYALVGGRVVTVGGPTHEKATVVVRDGLIEAVGPSVRAPADARVIDATGMVVTPGLIDAFSGIGLPSPSPSPSRMGGSSDRPSGGASPAPLAPQALALERVRASDAARARDQGITSALVVPPEGVLPGRSVLINTAGEKPDEMALRQPAALHLHMGTLSRQYPGSLMGTMALARQALLDAAHYRDTFAAYEKAPRGRKRPRYDAGRAAWADVLSGREPLVVTARRENDIRRALALADEFKVRVIVAGAMQAARVADLVKARGVPLLVSVNFDPPGAPSFFGGSDEEKERREIAEAEKNPAELHRAGVRFALVSGHAPDFLAGVRKAVERGLPAEAALRALTAAPAEALGVSDRLGTLEPGRIANLVAWSGEPLAQGTKPKFVFVDGEPYEPEEKPGRRGRDDGEGEASPEPSPAPSTNEPRERQPEERAPERKPGPEAVTQASPAPPPAASRPLAIVGATVLTVGPAGTIERGTVLVRDGRIAAVGADVRVPAGAEVIDGKGLFVMPGIIDAHSHTAVEGGVNECTDAITAEVRVADVIDHRDVDIYRQLAGGVTAINVLHGSCNAIGGQSGVLKMRWGADPEGLVFRQAPRGIKFALGENPKRSNFGVPGQRRWPGSRMGVEALLRQHFREAQDYRREWQEWEKAGRARGEPAPRRNLRLETIRDILDGRVLVHAHCYRSDEILVLIGLADEFGFKVRTFQHVLEGYKVATEIARHGAGASTFSDWWAYKMEAWDAIPYNAAIMQQHGVNVSLNSDSNELARRLYWEAAKAVKYGGVPEAEALRMITLNPAWQLGVDKQVGSIEVGKDADLAVFGAHPFSPDARVEMTLVDGVVRFDRKKDLASRATAVTGGGAR